GQAALLGVVLPVLARCEAGLGRFDDARAHGAEGLEVADRTDQEATSLYSLAAFGFAELGAGRAEAALTHLDRAAALAGRQRHREPAMGLFAPDRVEALLRAGRRAEAEEALAELEEGAERTGGAWAHAAAARCRAMLVDEDAVEAQIAEALRWHEGLDMPFERARTELILGERLRRARRRADARDPLQAALTAFERLGAEPWAARARTELRATGGRAADHEAGLIEELTPHELQVALLVAEGRTNREVGAALFLSPKTIEHHLSAIYRKLGLRSRTQLAALLSDEVERAAA
ncbi:MAG TPA: helix-turn-helix transcriptional regulator, partial [Capillimicrobium sp.]